MLSVYILQNTKVTTPWSTFLEAINTYNSNQSMYTCVFYLFGDAAVLVQVIEVERPV